MGIILFLSLDTVFSFIIHFILGIVLNIQLVLFNQCLQVFCHLLVTTVYVQTKMPQSTFEWCFYCSMLVLCDPRQLAFHLCAIQGMVQTCKDISVQVSTLPEFLYQFFLILYVRVLRVLLLPPQSFCLLCSKRLINILFKSQLNSVIYHHQL